MDTNQIHLTGVSALMDRVLRGRARRTIDRLAIQKFGLPAHTLMENAGRGTVRAIAKHFGPLRNRRIVICCGRGNNGGDGFVIARVIHSLGAHVHVVALGEPSSLESALNLRLLEALKKHDSSGQLELTNTSESKTALPSGDLYIDALFGTGLSRPVEGPAARFVAQLTTSAAPVIAVDIPSGLDADSGQVWGEAVRARLTVTMGALKPGLLLGAGPQCTGTIRVIDIGIPAFLLNDPAITDRSWRTTDEGVAAWLPSRPIDAHKYSAGMVLVVGGSRGYYGAPVMASEAAARIGAGYVACAVPQDVQQVIAKKLIEIPTIGLPTSADGVIQITAALAALEPWLAKARALLIGPGLGRHKTTQKFVRRLLAQAADMPTVVDADGLYALSRDEIADQSNGRWILTPHLGEFKRLAAPEAEISDRLHVAQAWAHKLRCTLVLKGLPSVIGSLDGDPFICGTGNPALATAGTGDVLSGLIAGLVAQGNSPLQAAVCGLHIGGAAANRYTARNPEVTMVATDMLREVPPALKAIAASKA